MALSLRLLYIFPTSSSPLNPTVASVGLLIEKKKTLFSLYLSLKSQFTLSVCSYCVYSKQPSLLPVIDPDRLALVVTFGS